MTRSKISAVTFLLIVILIVLVSGMSAVTGQEPQDQNPKRTGVGRYAGGFLHPVNPWMRPRAVY